MSSDAACTSSALGVTAGNPGGVRTAAAGVVMATVEVEAAAVVIAARVVVVTTVESESEAPASAYSETSVRADES